MNFRRYIALFERIQYPLIIALVVMCALYTLSFFQFIPKWDSVRGYLPYRHFISQYVHEGHMPLWNPFQRLGYPGYSDLQSGAWYPVMWLLLLLGEYDITSLIIEVVGCFLIAGWGMYVLSNHLHACKRTATLLGVSYALSGFMVGSTQLMVFLIGMAWLPWILWSLLKLLEDGHWRYGLLLAVFVMMNITGAGPAFTIILIYILPVISIVQLWKRRSEISYLGRVVRSLILSFSVLLLLLLPFLIAFIDFYPYFNRTGKLAYADMIINPFVPADYLSFLYPYATLSTGSWFQVTDLSLRNAYIGLIGLVFFVIALFSQVGQSRYRVGLIIGFALSILLALGDYSGIYQWVYHLPGFGLFRHPAFFRGYSIICMLLLSGYALSGYLKGDLLLKYIKQMLVTLLALSAIALTVGLLNTSMEDVKRSLHEISVRFEFPAAGFYPQLVIASTIAIVMLSGFWLISKATGRLTFTALLVVVGLDFFIQTQLTAPTTIHHAIDYTQTKNYFHQLDELPEHDQRLNNRALSELDESRDLLRTEGLERNVSTFNHTVSADGENPMRFKAFDRAKESGKLNWVLANPLFYVPTRFADASDSVSAGCIFGVPMNLDAIGDSCRLESPLMDFNAYSVQVNNASNQSRWLVLNTNYHHLWKAQLNEGSLEIKPVNEVVMGVLIPPKTAGVVQFVFDSPFLLPAWLISVLTLLAAVVGILVFRNTPQKD
ncbi:MAG: YfhO family protein [Flavobacteriales bacterium]